MPAIAFFGDAVCLTRMRTEDTLLQSTFNPHRWRTVLERKITAMLLNLVLILEAMWRILRKLKTEFAQFLALFLVRSVTVESMCRKGHMAEFPTEMYSSSSKTQQMSHSLFFACYMK